MAGSDHKPRVILVGGDGRPSGVPRHILHLVNALQEDADLTVITDEDQGGYTPLASMQARHVIVRGLTNRPSPRHLWRGIHGLLRAFDAAPADLIWVHARLPILLLRLLLALRLWRPTYPVAFTHHGLPYGPGYTPAVHWTCKQLERILIATCPPQHLIFLNHRMAGWMARDTRGTWMARHHVHVLPNCSDLRPFPPQKAKPQGKRTLVMTGRTGRQKDYAYAARLLAALPERYQLLLCGPGTEDPAFQHQITASLPEPAAQRISFTGPLPDARLPLLGADAYLLTSRYEGTPIGALEAFEAGLPIILRNFDGATDLTSLHPCALLIGEAGMTDDAAAIEALIDRFEANTDPLRTEIQAIWRRRWSPRLFQRNARILLRAMTATARPAAVSPDYAHDAPVPHPDHRRSVAFPAPVPPPSGTAVSPSAGSE